MENLNYRFQWLLYWHLFITFIVQFIMRIYIKPFIHPNFCTSFFCQVNHFICKNYGLKVLNKRENSSQNRFHKVNTLSQAKIFDLNEIWFWNKHINLKQQVGVIQISFRLKLDWRNANKILTASHSPLINSFLLFQAGFWNSHKKAISISIAGNRRVDNMLELKSLCSLLKL